tara:strand:+ start:1012 stop:1182 length:171 start_codon:yes stop_codon:yes gene_type:complete
MSNTKTYTREQLVDGMLRYNQAYIKTPSDYTEEPQSTREYAEAQVDELIKHTEYGK